MLTTLNVCQLRILTFWNQENYVVRVGLKSRNSVTHFEGTKLCLSNHHSPMCPSEHVPLAVVASAFLKQLAIFRVRVLSGVVIRLYIICTFGKMSLNNPN
jgi:hypothetical protein